jgi:hypothetical protein
MRTKFDIYVFILVHINKKNSYLFMIEKLKTRTQWTKFQGATNKYDNSDLWRDTTQQMLRRWMRITWLDVQLCLSNLLREF